MSTLLAPGMGAQIESVGAYMRERLARLPHVQEVRGFGLMNGIDPVSYTHLDVYKRQALI